jgi:hypothetical protein
MSPIKKRRRSGNDAPIHAEFQYDTNDADFGIDRTAATLERLFGTKRTEPQDECIEYCLYPDTITHDSHPKLLELVAMIKAFTLQWTDGYIWHKDHFHLSIHHDRGLLSFIK